MFSFFAVAFSLNLWILPVLVSLGLAVYLMRPPALVPKQTADAADLSPMVGGSGRAKRPERRHISPSVPEPLRDVTFGGE